MFRILKLNIDQSSALNTSNNKSCTFPTPHKTEDETTHEILYHTFLLARFQQTNVTSSRFLDSLFLLTSIWLLLLYSLVISSSPLCSCLKFCHVGTSRVGCSGYMHSFLFIYYCCSSFVCLL